MNLRVRNFGVQLAKRTYVVQNPEGTAMRSDDNIILVND
jgi:hypothetical protein